MDVNVQSAFTTFPWERTPVPIEERAGWVPGRFGEEKIVSPLSELYIIVYHSYYHHLLILLQVPLECVRK